jgi:hypothetical protein
MKKNPVTVSNHKSVGLAPVGGTIAVVQLGMSVWSNSVAAGGDDAALGATVGPTVRTIFCTQTPPPGGVGLAVHTKMRSA